MIRRNLKIKCGSAEYSGIFEQNIVKGVVFKTFIGIPKEIECKSIRVHNALMFAQYMLKREIINDEQLFDKCYLNNRGWEYEPSEFFNKDISC